jgi:hypothetical protein
VWPTNSSASIENIVFGGYGKDIAGATSKYDGLANTRALVSSEHGHPAALWAASQTIEGHSDCYLPSLNELAHARIFVPQLFEKGWYITSTQYSPIYAYGQNFDGGYTGNIRKGNECRARLVRRVSDLAL